MVFLVDFCLAVLVLTGAFALGVTTLTLVRELRKDKDSEQPISLDWSSSSSWNY